MRNPVPLIVLAALVGCGNATKEQSLDNADDIEGVHLAIGALTARIDAAEVSIDLNASEADLAETQADLIALQHEVNTNQQAIQVLDANLAMLELVVQQNTAGVTANALALATLDAQLHDPDSGEIPLLAVQDAAHTTDLAQLRTDLDTTALAVGLNGQGVAGNTNSIDENSALTLLNSAAASENAESIQSHAETLVDLAVAAEIAADEANVLTDRVTANETELLLQGEGVDANTELLTVHAATLVEQTNTLNLHRGEILGNGEDVALNTDAILLIEDTMVTKDQGVAFQAELDGQQVQIDSNRVTIGAIALDYLIGADRTALNTAIDDVAADVAVIQTNYLPDLDALLPFLSADPDTSTVRVSAADLVVDGRVYSDSLSFRSCEAGDDSCSPRACISLCQANNEHMASLEEVLAYAAAGNDECRWSWMLDANNPDVPVAGFPMYSDQLSSGCGATNTGDVPRLGGLLMGADWDDPQQFNCACSSK